MAQRVFIKVLGFNDVERHALNTLFRLSEDGPVHYVLWLPDAPEPPQLVLVDGQSYEAAMALAAMDKQPVKYIWVGPAAPQDAWRSFERPLSWPEVVNAMDQLFAPVQEVDFDLALDEASEELDSGGPDTVPSELEPPGKRALIVAPTIPQRLYLRARLSLAGLTLADEAETGAQALEMARMNHYSVALAEFALPDMNGLALAKQLKQGQAAVPHVVLTKVQVALIDRMQAWFAGVDGILPKPPDPGRLHRLLQKV